VFLNLVGGFNSSEKYEFVSWAYYSQYMESHKTCSKPPTSYSNCQSPNYKSGCSWTFLLQSQTNHSVTSDHKGGITSTKIHTLGDLPQIFRCKYHKVYKYICVFFPWWFIMVCIKPIFLCKSYQNHPIFRHHQVHIFHTALLAGGSKLLIGTCLGATGATRNGWFPGPADDCTKVQLHH